MLLAAVAPEADSRHHPHSGDARAPGVAAVQSDWQKWVRLVQEDSLLIAANARLHLSMRLCMSLQPPRALFFHPYAACARNKSA